MSGREAHGRILGELLLQILDDLILVRQLSRHSAGRIARMSDVILSKEKIDVECFARPRAVHLRIGVKLLQNVRAEIREETRRRSSVSFDVDFRSPLRWRPDQFTKENRRGRIHFSQTRRRVEQRRPEKIQIRCGMSVEEKDSNRFRFVLEESTEKINRVEIGDRVVKIGVIAPIDRDGRLVDRREIVRTRPISRQRGENAVQMSVAEIPIRRQLIARKLNKFDRISFN